MNSNIIGYHTNSIAKSNRFLAGKDLELSKDTHFLGEGMYFWDNLSNARWWGQQKMKKDVLDEVHVSTARIVIDDMLDLTDAEEVLMVRDFWNIFCAKKRYKNEKKFQVIGCILDTIFKTFPEHFECYKVVKCHGDYSRMSKLYWLVELGDYARIDNRPKTIYSIKHESVIVERSHLEKISH